MTMCYPDTADWGCALSPDEIAGLDPVIKARSEMLAWTTLQRLTGYRLALCPVAVRPCAARCNPGAWMEAPVSGFPADGPYISQGTWYNACGCTSSELCDCGPLSEVILPAPEVGGVSVKINGGTLSPSAYRVDNGNRLVRTDGGTWPLCQDAGGSGGASEVVIPVTAGDPGNSLYTGTVTFSRVGDQVTVTIDAVADHDESNFTTASYPDFVPLGYRLAGSGKTIIVNLDPEVVTVSFPDYVQPNLLGFYTQTFPVNAGDPFRATITYATNDPAPASDGGTSFEVTYYPGLMTDDALNLAAGLLAVEWYKACTGKDCGLPPGATRIQRQGISFEVPADMFANGLSGIRQVDAIVAAYNPYRLVTPSATFNPDARKTGRVRTA